MCSTEAASSCLSFLSGNREVPLAALRCLGRFDGTQASPLLEKIEEYNRQHGFREVGFVSRSGKQAAGLESWPDSLYAACVSAQARAIFLPNSSFSPRVAPWHGLHLAGSIWQTNNIVETTGSFCCSYNSLSPLNNAMPSLNNPPF